jgi:hypothetical protein
MKEKRSDNPFRATATLDDAAEDTWSRIFFLKKEEILKRE